MDKPCGHCGRPMLGRVRARARFCSVACKDADRTARRRAAAEQRPARSCLNCGLPMAASLRAHARVCSLACRIKYENRKRADLAKQERRKLIGPCLGCGGAIPTERRSNAIFCSAKCKSRINAARWRERAPAYMRRYLYGITSEEFAARLAAQGGRCAICRTDTPGGKGGWHVDHDHETKAIRGLLCHSCNVALGNFADDPARLRAAIAYLGS